MRKLTGGPLLCLCSQVVQKRKMHFDDQLRRYFGTCDVSAITPAVLSSGIEHMAVDLGLEQDRGRRFALWALMHMLGAAPDLEIVFAEEADRNVARDFMNMAGRTDNS